MPVQCEICDEQTNERFRFCKSCNDSLPQTRDVRESMKIYSYYDEKNNLRPEIFQGLPERLASLFKSGKPTLSYGMLRKFLEMIQRAWEKSENPSQSKTELEKTKRFAEYQKNRGIVPAGFAGFIKKHIYFILKSSNYESDLKGFLELLTSIAAYSVRKERR